MMPNLKQVIEMVKDSWSKVNSETIKNCWVHSGIQSKNK
jgi:hypothetical protein